MRAISAQTQDIISGAEAAHESLSAFAMDEYHGMRRCMAYAKTPRGALSVSLKRLSIKKNSIEDIFDMVPKTIDTNPQKYTTHYDSYTDQTFPTIVDHYERKFNLVLRCNA